MTALTPPPEQWTYALPVPFVAQQGAHADYRRADCGAACTVSIARYRYVRDGYLDPVNFQVNDFVEKTRLATADTGLTSEQIAALLRGYGLNAAVRKGLTLDDLQACIRAGNPPIVLCNYKHINKRHPGDLGHYVVLVGSRADAFLIHDPYLLGANISVPNAALMQSMADVALYTSVPMQGVVLT